MKKIYFLLVGVLFFGTAVAAPEQPSQQRRSIASTPTIQSRAARQLSATAVRQQAPVSGVTARAATKQNVVQNNVGVAAANTNTTVSEECKSKYYGCMDSFCMLENDNGGRCLCSDRKSDLDNILAEIEKIDAQSRSMATTGVEKIGLGTGDKANYVMDATKSASSTQQSNTRARQTLDLDIFDAQPTFGFEAEQESSDLEMLKDKTGDALHASVREMCIQQIPECEKDIKMLQLMYAQTIQSDCRAYENYLKKMKDESSKKLLTAEKALRDAALQAYENSNKWDLGQCAVEMRKCMQDEARGACGSDWTGCVGIVAAENARSSTATTKTFEISGSATKIQIAASTYDAMLSKKPICKSITQNCIAAVSKDKDAVWNTFLREIAPALKSAELLAEANRRTSCISNISECFKKGCADTMSDETSYDLCLSRPEAMLSICKVQLNECGISTTSATAAKKSMIWDYVTARLAAMRVDSCTKELKTCLQSEDRCGADYTQCVGLDTDTIIRMCPYDKLTGCQKKYQNEEIKGSAVYEEIANMVQGIFLNIDNNMLNACQKAADEAMVKVCGTTENCDGLAVDDGIGSHTLEYKICGYTTNSSNLDINSNGCKTSISQITDAELRANTPLAGVLDGIIFWDSVDYDDTGKLKDVSNYEKKSSTTLSASSRSKVKSEITQLQNSIDVAISAIESDSTVKSCINGREVQASRVNGATQTLGSRKADSARYPDLTKQMRILIANSALKAAKANYYTKYDELNAKMLEDQASMAERIGTLEEEDAQDAHRAAALSSCKALASSSILPISSTAPANTFGQMLGVWMTVSGAVAAPLTGGASLAMSAAGITSLASNNSTTAAITKPSTSDLTATQTTNQWNYKQVITTTFNWDTLVCTRAIRAQTCKKTANPLFGSKYCKKWNDAMTNSKNFQF